MREYRVCTVGKGSERERSARGDWEERRFMRLLDLVLTGWKAIILSGPLPELGWRFQSFQGKRD